MEGITLDECFTPFGAGRWRQRRLSAFILQISRRFRFLQSELLRT